MKRLICFVMFLFVLAFPVISRGQEKVAPKMQRIENAVNMFADSYVSLPQAPAVIEAVPAERYGSAVNVSLQTPPRDWNGSTLALRMSLPNGDKVNLGSYTLTGCVSCRLYFELWSGPFPNAWPAGLTTFEAIMVIPGSGPSYVSAPVCVFCGNVAMGIIDRADVSVDGNQIDLQGSFSSDTIAFINGAPVNVVITPFHPFIRTDQVYGSGQMNLTVCSNGACSSRFVYLPNRPNQGGRG